MSKKIYELYGSDQRVIDNLKRKIRGYEKMKKDITSQNRKVNNQNRKLQQENKKYKEVINKAIKHIEENRQHEYRNGNSNEYYLELNEKEMTGLLDILKEVKDK